MIRHALLAAFLFVPGVAAAQTTSSRVVGAAEFTAGYAGFVDDALIDHGVVGGSGRVYVTPWLSIGPELVYMKGPGSDRDLFLTGNVTIDFRGDKGGQARIIPFVVAGAGMMRHSDRFGVQEFSSSEGAFTAGGGVRGNITDRVFVGAEFRAGWELHARFTGIVGVRFGS